MTVTTTTMVVKKQKPVANGNGKSNEDHNRFEEFRKHAGMSFKQHQYDGVMWCLANERIGVETLPGKIVKGGLIADEMGLGKTFQMISTMICNFKLHTLVVLPLILLDQWVAAIKNATGYTPLVYRGSEKKRITLEKLEQEPIVITTYSMIRVEANTKGRTLLHYVRWDRVVFDEAHHLRNHANSVFNGARRLKSGIKWLITGTPIQNRKSDFYNLCSVMGLPSDYYNDDSNLMTLVKGFILRRTKAEAGIQLPTLTEKTEMVAWNTKTGEKRIAESIHSQLKFANMEAGKMQTMMSTLDNGKTPLVNLLRARQVCILPNMLTKRVKNHMTESNLEMHAVFDANHEHWYLNGLNTTSKLDAVINKIIERKSNGKRKLMFCHYRQEIDAIAYRLRREDLHVVTFDGRTSDMIREKILTSKSIDVLILQIQTGCEGLNLQQFSEIYFVSPHWNPAIEDQAVARCHRIGQTEPVDVFRFQMECFDKEMENSSLDIYSSNVQEYKRSIMKEIEDARAANPQDDDYM